MINPRLGFCLGTTNVISCRRIAATLRGEWWRQWESRSGTASRDERYLAGGPRDFLEGNVHRESLAIRNSLTSQTHALYRSDISLSVSASGSRNLFHFAERNAQSGASLRQSGLLCVWRAFLRLPSVAICILKLLRGTGVGWQSGSQASVNFYGCSCRQLVAARGFQIHEFYYLEPKRDYGTLGFDQVRSSNCAFANRHLVFYLHGHLLPG